jgi:hypothetical protein
MDGLTFIDHLIGHLAWPLAVTSLVAFLSLRHRKAIDGVISRLHKAKAGGLFEIELAELKDSADQAQLPPPPVITPRKAPSARREIPQGSDPEVDVIGEEFARLAVLASRNPRRAVAETYQFVNRYALEASEQLDPEQTRYTDGAPDTMRTAAVTILAPQHADVLDHLRDAALRASDRREKVSTEQAIDYAILAMRLVVAMQGSIRDQKGVQSQTGEGPNRPQVPRGRRGTPPPA